MSKNIFYTLFFFLFLSFSAQTNQHIKNSADNSLLNDVVYFCPSEQFNLKVDAQQTSTGNYTLQPVSGFLIANGSNLVPFSNKTGNNHFSKPIPLGFTFSFYGQNYTNVVVGSNGRLLFSNSADFNNFNDTTKYIDRTHSGNSTTTDFAKLPSVEYNKIDISDPTKITNIAQIFAGYTDIGYYNQNDYNKLTYANIIYNGKKGLLISFDSIIELYTNYGSLIKSQILLLEDNHYIINIVSRTQDVQNAIIGAQNETGAKAVWAINSESTSVYNNGKWKTNGGNLAYEFVPSQNLTPKVDWFVDNVLTVSNNTNFSNYAPQDASGTGENLKINLAFYDNTGTQVGATESSSVTFKKLQAPQISAPNYQSGCGNPAEIHVLNPDPKLNYDWYSNTDPTFHQTGTSIQAGNGSYYVQVKNTAGNCVIKSASQIVNISSVLPAFIYDNQTIKICDNLGLASQNFNLQTVTNYPSGSNYSVEFFENGIPVTTSSINSGQIKNFSIKVTTNSGVTPACTFTKNFSISYLSFPPNGTNYTQKNLCSETTSYSTSEFKSNFFPGTTFQFVFSVDGINYNLTSVNPKVNNPIFVKITDANFTCESVVKLNFFINPVVVANTPNPNDPNLQQCASATQTYDLHALFDQQVNSGNVTITYHLSLNGAQTGDNSIPNPSSFRSGLGSTAIYIRVVDNVTGCVAQNFPTVTLVVYLKPKIVVSNPIILKNCTGNNIYNLTQNISSLTDASSPIVVSADYFSENGIPLSASQISNYDASILGTKPYISLSYNTTCGDTVYFDLQHYPKPVAKISQIPVCGETSYTLANFLNKIIDNPANYTFTDENGNALPNSFNVSVLPKVVKVIITDKTTGCKSDIQTITFISGNPTPVLSTTKNFEKCDEDSNAFDGFTSFNLDDLKSQFSSDSSSIFEYFKDSGRTQKIAANYTNEVAFSQTIYGRVTSSGFCPTNFTINLIINTPTKSSTLQDKYYVCYGDQLIIDAGPENLHWVWSIDNTDSRTKTFTYKNIGNFSVKLTNSKGCSYTHNFVISDENQPVIQQINQTNSQIEVIATGGILPYQYSFDGGITWQNSNILLTPTLDEYTIQVRSSNGCLGAPKSIYNIVVNNLITPNGDGKNDVWNIENLDKMENIEIIISDRYGKNVFHATDKNSLTWDGTVSRKLLPTSTYWYTVKWHDPTTNKDEIRQGWILLKNRE